MIEYNTLVVLVGVSLLAASAGLVGCFAMLRRRALMGDALAHAALPGVVLAYLLYREYHLPVLLAGAFATGLLGVQVVAVLDRWTRIKEDAAIGIVLSVFFGAGIVLLRVVPEGTASGLNAFILGKTAGMVARDVYLIAAAALLFVVLVLLFYKEFQLVVFDPDFAQAQGWPALRLELLLMALVALTVVIGLPAVGVVMIAALLIVPNVAARFWTDRLGVMVALASVFGVLMGVTGTWISATFDHMPAGPTIVLVGSAVFVVSLLLAPRRGLLARWLARRAFDQTLRQRKLLRVLYELSEPSVPPPMPLSFRDILRARSWTAPQLRRWLARLERLGWLRRVGADGYALTPDGLRRAADLVRGQRLWELYRTEYPELASGTAELTDEALEKVLPAPILADLTAKLRTSGRMPM